MKKTGAEYECNVCGKTVYKSRWELNRAAWVFCSNKCYWKSLKGRKLPQSTRGKMSKSFTGRKYSEEHNRKIRVAQTGKPKWNIETIKKISGENNHMWKGGISTENQLVRHSYKYVQCRRAVVKRDSGRCIKCGSIKKLHADHIKPFSTYPELRFELSNGRTLCEPCHKQTETWGNKKKIRICH